MNNSFMIALGILIPFLGTTLGAGIVFLFKNEINEKIQKVLLGFSSGVMIAASVWSLIIPALEKYDNPYLGALICSLGIILGVAFLMLSNRYLNVNKVSDNILAFAVTLHNIPEGMAVGVAFAEVLNGSNNMIAFSLALGIAIQNIPEGATISLPFRSAGVNTKKSFFYGVLSGAVEPIFACITFLISSFISTLLPFLLSFAAGAMLLVVVEELIPEVHLDSKNSLGTIGIITGFIIMMVLDNIF